MLICCTSLTLCRPPLRFSSYSPPRSQSLDKALIAWGVKSAPGEPEIDFKEKIKSAGLAGALAYGGTELGFWIISVPLAVVVYHQTTGEWLDLTTLEGKETASGEMVECVCTFLVEWGVSLQKDSIGAYVGGASARSIVVPAGHPCRLNVNLVVEVGVRCCS